MGRPTVVSVSEWPDAVTLESPHLLLLPLAINDAVELAPLLDDVVLHEFTGGSPATEAELLARFKRQVAGFSTDRTERWLNWVVRLRSPSVAIGLMQSTVTASDDGFQAALAWVIAPGYQGRGYAQEAAAALKDWVVSAGATSLVAFVHPEHTASEVVARSIGLRPSSDRVDGEVVWLTTGLKAH
jgi:RimJ/RimL family protein N-acetyltransferase